MTAAVDESAVRAFCVFRATATRDPRGQANSAGRGGSDAVRNFLGASHAQRLAHCERSLACHHLGRVLLTRLYLVADGLGRLMLDALVQTHMVSLGLLRGSGLLHRPNGPGRRGRPQLAPESQVFARHWEIDNIITLTENINSSRKGKKNNN